MSSGLYNYHTGEFDHCDMPATIEEWEPYMSPPRYRLANIYILHEEMDLLDAVAKALAYEPEKKS